jgi:plastocyanin
VTRILLLVAVLAVGTAFASLAGTAGAGSATTVKLGDNFFKPKRKAIAKNTKVRFKWIGTNPHNVTKVRGPGRNFASDTTSAPGVNFKKRFRKRGRYKLICTVHPDQMRMRLRVRRRSG